MKGKYERGRCKHVELQCDVSSVRFTGLYGEGRGRAARNCDWQTFRGHKRIDWARRSISCEAIVVRLVEGKADRSTHVSVR